MFVVLAIQSWIASTQTVERLSYSDFLKMLRAGQKLTEVVVQENSTARQRS